MNHEIVGRKVFVLNPHSFVTEDLVGRLLAAEYEVYLLYDREKTMRVLRKFPDSVLFVTIDSDRKPELWEDYVRGIMGNPGLEQVRVGILSYNPDDELAEKYLMEIGVPCGFVRLRAGIDESSRIMLKTLQANEAKGRRKYVRVRCDTDSQARFNVMVNGKLLEGRILDISSVGMAGAFQTDTALAPGTQLPDLQLRLRSSLVHLTGVVLNRRADNKSVYVILFKHGIETTPRHQVRMYIHGRLQEEIDRIAGNTQ